MYEIKTKDFDLKLTLTCGQFFRYTPWKKGYIIQSREKIFWANQKGNKLIIKGKVKEKWVKHFFSIDQDFKKVKKSLLKDKYTKKAYEKYPGIRIMRQDPWECTISYILSAASNIPKIQSSIQKISESFGKPISFFGFKSHTFPKPGTITCERTTRKSGCGFRAPYIILANQRFTDKNLKILKNKSYKEAKEYLIKSPGIGEKIADCILLFSLEQPKAFPIDVWIRRIMQKLYWPNATDKEILARTKQKFGLYRGYAQQYLFHWARDKKIKF